jgi:hypothetical protein
MTINIQGTLNHPNPTATAADTPQPETPKLSPEVVVAQLRALRDQLPQIAPLTPQQRTSARKAAQMPPEVLQASIDVIGASDDVSSAIKQPVGDVHVLQDETNRWNAVENELKALLNGVSGANLLRRHRLALIAGQAYAIGTQLTRDPANVLLLPHVQEVKRLKKVASISRKKSLPKTPGAPTPGTPGTPAPQSTPQQHTTDAPPVKA